ncbi:unnamed protein product [Peronospora farinosa]|uniref:Geranylgeranyl pyrophosphate synthase n=1 Tax=Peronospora farinosa TaxID=134698 RepID=A0AAV0USV7_9STRA|nr:unnamed protein product [Peronospora farinosa]
MEMKQVRLGRASQVAVPPVNTAPLEISQEMRQQLRVTRHRAFERYQENAHWTKELLEGSTTQDDVIMSSNGCAASAEELQMQVEAQEKTIQEQERKLVQQKERHETTQRRFEEMLTMLNTAKDATQVKECEEELANEKMLLLPCKPRKMEIIRTKLKLVRTSPLFYLAMATVQENETKLLEPYAYISELPGKGVRGKMIGAFQTWLCAPFEAVESIQRIVDQLHNASLLIDDIEDDSEMRRGQPVAHHIFGVPATINCANYVYFLSLQKCQALGNPKAMQVYTNEMLRLHQGQGMDIFWRDHLQCPTVDEYLEMTGGLFRLAVGLMQAFSDSILDFTPLVNALAVYFQIRDDYINLLDEAYMENKSFCEDLTEGKFSFPLIVAIRENPQDTRLLSILKQRTKSTKLKQYAVHYLRETGAVKLTLAKLNDTVQEIRNEIASLGGNLTLEQIVDGLHSTIK